MCTSIVDQSQVRKSGPGAPKVRGIPPFRKIRERMGHRVVSIESEVRCYWQTRFTVTMLGGYSMLVSSKPIESRSPWFTLKVWVVSEQ